MKRYMYIDCYGEHFFSEGLDDDWEENVATGDAVRYEIVSTSSYLRVETSDGETKEWHR